MATDTHISDGLSPASKLLAGHPVHDPSASLVECGRVTRLMRAVLWFDAGEAAWREGELHASHHLRQGIWLAYN